MAQCVDIGDRFAARDQDRGQIDQHPSPIVDRNEPAPRQRLRHGLGKADPIGQQPDRGRSGQRRHPGAVGCDRQALRPASKIHFESAPCLA